MLAGSNSSPSNPLRIAAGDIFAIPLIWPYAGHLSVIAFLLYHSRFLMVDVNPPLLPRKSRHWVVMQSARRDEPSSGGLTLDRQVNELAYQAIND